MQIPSTFYERRGFPLGCHQEKRRLTAKRVDEERRRFMRTLWAMFGAVSIIVAVSTLIIAIHEAGHLLAGRLVGLRWKAFGVGALLVSRESGRWQPSVSHYWQGGLVQFMPPDKRVTRLKLAAVHLGGVVANLLFGLALLEFVLLQSPKEQEYSNPLGWLGAIGCLSIFTALVNLLPFRLKYRGLASDGLLLWTLLRQGRVYRTYYAQWSRAEALAALADAVKRGQRPRDWDGAKVALATALCDGTEGDAFAAHYAFYWAADRDDLLGCDRYISKAVELLDTFPGTMQRQVLLDAAFHHALHSLDSVCARALMARADKVPHQDDEDEDLRRSMTLRSQAAALLAEGHPSEARDTAREALSVLLAASSNNVADWSLTERLISRCSITEPT